MCQRRANNLQIINSSQVKDLDKVMQQCPGETIADKRKWITDNCPKGESYIEWQIDKGELEPALTPQYFVSHRYV
jgi:hypothetical protein